MQIEFYNDSNGELLSPEKILDFEWYPDQKLSSFDYFYETAYLELNRNLAKSVYSEDKDLFFKVFSRYLRFDEEVDDKFRYPMSVRDSVCMTGYSRILYNKFSGKDLGIDLIESSIEYGVGGPEIAINLTERVKNNSYWKNIDVSNKTSVIKLEKWNSDVWFIKEIDFIDSETILNLKENMSKEYLYFSEYNYCFNKSKYSKVFDEYQNFSDSWKSIVESQPTETSRCLENLIQTTFNKLRTNEKNLRRR